MGGGGDLPGTKSGLAAPVAERVVLRAWRPSDREAFAALNADPEVMRWLGGPASRSTSDALARRIEDHFAAHGFGLWALEVPGEAPFAGYVGLNVPAFDAAFTPCVEVGWRLARAFWNRGFATEAARACLRHGFDVLRLDEIVSFTAVGNVRSQRVMRRLGMRRSGEFDHPLAPEGHELQRHVLYRLGRGDAFSSSSGSV